MRLTIPELSLVVLIGPSGAGKSTFAARHFLRTETVSSDFCRGLVSDDENSMDATDDAFEILHAIAAKRLAQGRLTVIDATNVQPSSRKSLVELAREYHCLPVAVVFNLPEKVCAARNEARPDRNFGRHVIAKQRSEMRRSMRGLGVEGFRHLHVLKSEEEVNAVEIVRQPLWTNLKHETGPFDIIGDVHGCFDELASLLEKLGYILEESATADGSREWVVSPPPGRRAIFLGDLVDRGPHVPDVLRLVMRMVSEGMALCVPGNHDVKLMRALRGRNVQNTHGLAASLEQLEAHPPEFRDAVAQFLDSLISHYVLDGGNLTVAHAGMKQEMQGRASGRVREFALYGETTGETDEFGLPVRCNWAEEYRGRSLVVYGHTPVLEPEWLNRTINIDTGCVFGGKLTALRYPEKEIVQVPALKVYADPIKPLASRADTPPGTLPDLTLQQEHDDLLHIEDVLGKRIIPTELLPSIKIQEENALAALEIMSRFAADPKWLIYLPPTMSPSETSRRPGRLEHPAEAFDYYRSQGVGTVVCQEKHMGSRAVVILCRNPAVARRRFGVREEVIGACVTRTGRPFFSDAKVGEEFLQRLLEAFDRAGFWEGHSTDWVCLDCELMPWSAKALELLRRQYAPVGAAARAALPEVGAALTRAQERGIEAIPALFERWEGRSESVEKYTAAYRHYCWPVTGIEDLRLAPFHILATEGAAHTDKNHLWHMSEIGALVAGGGCALLHPTLHLSVDLSKDESVLAGVRWWEDLTERGGEGMVVKPLDYVARGIHGLVQPALKCRGAEYLRIIYGPEYDAPENLDRLRRRGLSRKRSLALREFSLGVEALARFTRGEPLRRVHECVFGVLALESEPVDPRL